MRSWYDIPFTTAESLLADEELTISVGWTFDGSSIPRIDSIEVYGRAKDEFGWKHLVVVLLVEDQERGPKSCRLLLSKSKFWQMPSGFSHAYTCYADQAALLTWLMQAWKLII